MVKQKAGELGHLDCHHLSTALIATDPTRYELVCVLDACTRLVYSITMRSDPIRPCKSKPRNT